MNEVIIKTADCVYSPLGNDTLENLEAVLRGESRLRSQEHPFGLPESACLSLFDREKVDEDFLERFPNEKPGEHSFFDKVAAVALMNCLKGSPEISPERTLFILSTTKGNVDALPGKHIRLCDTAKKIAETAGLNAENVLTVSNACVSGVCAINVAYRMLSAWGTRYDTAITLGADVLSPFIISGFQSFKALSPEPCKPYDINRCGLNLGEGAAAMVWRKAREENARGHWSIAEVSNHNDSNHISGPSRTGEGSYLVLKDLLAKAGIPDLVSTHGTATNYNDEMESTALHRSNLEKTDISSFKGYFGHTLGAAGLLESALAMAAADRDIIPATRGFSMPGVTYPLGVSPQNRKKENIRKVFKILSGFGGSNAGAAFVKL